MTSDDTAKTRVVIYGSCVSRDTFEFLDQGAFQLDRYIARQSLISAYAQPTPLDDADIDSLASAFQKRTIRDDFRGSLHEDLQTFGADADLLLWDLTDERYGVWDLGHGQFVTRSVELISSGIDARLRTEATLVPFGSKRHLTLWSAALEHFTSTVQSAGFTYPVVLLAPRWATRDDSGAKVHSALGPDTRFANRMIRRYLQHAEPITAITTRRSETQASSTHQWGSAPYHYVDAVYSTVSREILAAVEAGQGRTTTSDTHR